MAGHPSESVVRDVSLIQCKPRLLRRAQSRWGFQRGEAAALPTGQTRGFKPRVRYNLTVSDWGRWRLHPPHSCYLGLRGLPSLHRPPRATLIWLAWLSSGHEVSSRGQWAATMRAPPDPAPRVLIPQIGACTNLNVHVPTAFNLAPL